jgi:hypothetical protein
VSAPAYLPDGVRRCESCGHKIVHARVAGGAVVAYDLAQHVYWLVWYQDGGRGELSLEPMRLSLEGGLTGLGPGVPHVRTCVDPRIPAADRAAFTREVVQFQTVGPAVQACRCGARIVFGRTRAGASMPLDVDTRVDWIQREDRELVAAAMPFDLAGGRSGLGAAVSHFRTCPKASEFVRQRPYASRGR